MSRRALHRGRWLAAVLDTLFIIVLGVIVVFVLYSANLGELRLYTFVGFALGFALYIIGLSPVITYIAGRIKGRKSKTSEKKDP